MNPEMIAVLKALGFREDEVDPREGVQRFIHNDAALGCTLVVALSDNPADITKALIQHGMNLQRVLIKTAQANLDALIR